MENREAGCGKVQSKPTRWEFVHRLWICVSGFESLPPSHLLSSGGLVYFRLSLGSSAPLRISAGCSRAVYPGAVEGLTPPKRLKFESLPPSHSFPRTSLNPSDSNLALCCGCVADCCGLVCPSSLSTNATLAPGIRYRERSIVTWVELCAIWSRT